ncbi:hypothetical protein AGMMS49938_04850 [Fibrobacterales bacterium]|nr:hypothetical protein AGMMS49938_04850 [Fibrobacterales bacterium]
MRFFVLLFCVATLAGAATHPWKIQITGASVYSEGILTEQLDLPPEMDLISSERRTFIIKLAKVNLDDFYQSNGYFSENINLTISGDSLYSFDIFEGDRYQFRNAELIISKEESLGDDTLNYPTIKEFSVTKGDYYNSEIINEDVRIIRDAYQKNGYLHLNIDHTEFIDTIAKKIDIRYILEPNNQVRMGNFSSKIFRSGYLPSQSSRDSAKEVGLSDTAWFNKLWKTPQGSIIDGNYYNSFRTKLFSTQLFSQIKLEDSLREDGFSDIQLTAYERVPGEAKYGFFFEELYGFGVSFSSLHRNLFGNFLEAGFGALIAENRQELSLSIANPLLFGTDVSWIPTAIRASDRIFFNHEILPVPAKPDSLDERWEIVNRGDISFGISDHIRTRNTIDFRFLNLNGENYFKIKGEIGLIFDFTNDPYDPVFGLRLSPTLGVGGELTNESFNEIEGMGDAANLFDIGLKHAFSYTNSTAVFYVPFSRFLYSALAFSYGKIFNKATPDDAQVFYQGGSRTLRGYKFRSVFPNKTLITVSDTGTLDTLHLSGLSPQYFRINEELRFNLPAPLRNFQVVQFTDWSRINDNDKSFEIATEMSVGFGLRYKWQFLTLRLDYAVKTEFKDFKPDKFQWSHIVFDLSQAI